MVEGFNERRAALNQVIKLSRCPEPTAICQCRHLKYDYNPGVWRRDTPEQPKETQVQVIRSQLAYPNTDHNHPAAQEVGEYESQRVERWG